VTLSDAVQHALKSPQQQTLRVAVHALYADLSHDITARQPRCDVSGRCCHFDEFGHRLYVTTAELAVFVADLPAKEPAASPVRSLPVLGASPSCDYLAEGLCSVHTIRPFGCRVFFCDPTAKEWMENKYETFHHRLRDLHQQFELPYFYVEWRAALRDLTSASLIPNISAQKR
jgi:Fe-S-cluster containining protein